MLKTGTIRSSEYRICYIDDSRTSAFVTGKLLRKLGYGVDHYSCAETAIDEIFEKNYALIITDLMLADDADGLNGDDVINLIRNCGYRDKQRLPIIVITGSNDLKIHKKLKKLGANSVLVKPLDGKRLAVTIQTIIDHLQRRDGSPVRAKPQVSSIRSLEPIDEKEFEVISHHLSGHGDASESAAGKTSAAPQLERAHEPPRQQTKPMTMDTPDIYIGNQLFSDGALNNQPSPHRFSGEAANSVLDNAEESQLITAQPEDAKPVAVPKMVLIEEKKPVIESPSSQNKTAKASLRSSKTKANANDFGNISIAASSKNSHYDVGDATHFNADKLNQLTSDDLSLDKLHSSKPKAFFEHDKINYDAFSVDDIRAPSAQLKITPAKEEHSQAASGFEKLTINDLVKPARSRQPSADASHYTKVNLGAAAPSKIPTLQTPLIPAEATSSAKQDNRAESTLEQASEARLASAVKPPEKISNEAVAPTPPSNTTATSVLDQALADALTDKQSKLAVQPERAKPPEKPKQETKPAASDNPLLSLLDDLEQGDNSTAAKKPSKKQASGTGKFFKRTVLLLLVALIGYTGWQQWQLRQQDIVVSTIHAERGDIHQSIAVPGKVVSAKKLDVTSFIAGKLTRLHVKEGDKVKAGQILAQLDNKEAESDVKRFQAKLLSAEEEVALTNKTQERFQKALSLGAVSRQTVEDAQAAWKAASARLSVSQEELKSAELTLQRLKISAPFRGIITRLYGQQGQWLAPPEPLLTLVDISSMEIELKVDAADSANLSVGQEVMLSSDAFPEVTWNERVTRIAPATSQNNAVNTLHIHVSLGDQAPELRIGQSVDAEIRIASNKDTLKLPFEALINQAGKSMVAVYRLGQVAVVPVSIGIEDFTHAEILSGITEQERIILPAGHELSQGQKVSLSSPATVPLAIPLPTP